jgi:hypothetical protein
MTVGEFAYYSQVIDPEELYKMVLKAQKNDERILVFTENTRIL